MATRSAHQVILDNVGLNDSHREALILQGVNADIELQRDLAGIKRGITADLI